MKCCKVIPMYFGKRRLTYESSDDVLALAKHIYEIEKSLNAGSDMSVDTIFVNNSPNSEVANNFFKSIDGAKTKSGKIRVIKGDNIGGSFGAYNKAYEKFKDEYDYWAFTEDDVLVNLDNYFDVAIKQLNSNQSLGYVAFVGLSSSSPIHAHNGAGVSSAKALRKVYKRFGELPYCKLVADGTSRENWSRQIHEGEAKFTNSFVKVGYNMEKINSSKKPYIRWSDEGKNIDLIYWGDTGYVV